MRWAELRVVTSASEWEEMRPNNLVSALSLSMREMVVRARLTLRNGHFR